MARHDLDEHRSALGSSELAPERRLNLLTGDWVLISPHRVTRPWKGEVASKSSEQETTHDPNCYLCPGSSRANGAQNPDYKSAYTFDNDYPALSLHADFTPKTDDDCLISMAEIGCCKVICYSPHHSLPMARMSRAEIRAVVEVWVAETNTLSAKDEIGAITIFENKGAMMGASNPHPHGQIWATQSVPNELLKENGQQLTWYEQRGSLLLLSYLERELREKKRIVAENNFFVALVPYWAAWPFETIVLPRRAISGLDQLKEDEKDHLSDILGKLTAAYDTLFNSPFPYSMGIHQRPFDGRPHNHFISHIHFFPPLLRSATIRKFMVGFEMFAMPQRDMTAEEAADRLRKAMD